MISGVLLLIMLLIGLPLALAVFIFWIWMLISAIRNPGLTEGEKICWVLVVVFLHFVGAILYFFIGHPKRKEPLSTQTT